ncbi:hypothetical protein JCM8547_002548 [Rhodosporidiobolus lusitaniae]
MARKKGVPQRPGGLSRDELKKAQEDEEREQQRIREEEERSRMLEELDRALEERHGSTPANGEDEPEKDGRELVSASPAVPTSIPPAAPSPVNSQVYYSTPSPALPNGGPTFGPPPRMPPSLSQPPQIIPPPVPLHATLPPALLRPLPASGPTPPALPAVEARKMEAPPGLSRFAEKYVPLWLRNVNASPPHMVVPRSMAEAFTINYTTLHNSLFPPQLHSHLRDIEAKNIQRISREFFASGTIHSTAASPISAIPSLTPTSYALHWIPLLAAEYNARLLQLQQAALYAVQLRPVPRHPSEPPGPPNYILEAKSIREGWPPVDLGDVLTLRQLRPAYQSWQGLEFQGSVCGINRAAGEVVLRCDGLAGAGESMVFNVQWKVQDRIFSEWRRTVELLDLHLTSDMLVSSSSADDNSGKNRRRTAVESWLFPIEEDVMSHLSNPTEEDEEYEWVDASLNEEQRNAVRSMLWGHQRLPLLLHGPPGTGKTKTLVEGVLQILKRHPHAHILVCGASNPSTDTLAMRLRSLMPKQLFRLNSPSRPFAEVRAELLPYCHVENERFALPSMSELLQKRVICCTVLDASLLLQARLSNHDLSTLEIYVQGNLHPTYSATGELSLARPHFSHLLVDEAGQATETDIGCALAVVATDDTRSRRAHVTICGDPCQLGPHISSEEARSHDFDISLLQRLMSRPVYSEHPYARKNRKRNPHVRWEVPTTPFINLEKNYRSTPEILFLPSVEFYHDTLVPAASLSIQQSPLRRWTSLPNPNFPIFFQHVAGQDLEIDDGASFFNDLEVAAVRDHVVALVRPPEGEGKAPHGVVKPREISVISPFREQVWRIRLALRAVGLGEVDVGNVEALQGAENRVVIISPVRSKELRWLPIDRQQGRGLLFEPKRFNVAMTRAKELLIVIGNSETLTLDPYFKAFYRLCLRNRCYVGPLVSHPGANELGHAVSRLEAEYVRQGPVSAKTKGAEQNEKRENGEEGEEQAGPGEEESKAFDILIGRLASQLVNGEEDDFPSLGRRR